MTRLLNALCCVGALSASAAVAHEKPNILFIMSDDVGPTNVSAFGDGIVGKIFKIGNQPMNARVEAHANVVKPNAASDWTIGGTTQFLFPR